jgi:hypothetical protein
LPATVAKLKLLLIAGQHVPSISGRAFKAFNSVTEQVIATVVEGDKTMWSRGCRCAPRLRAGGAVGMSRLHRRLHRPFVDGGGPSTGPPPWPRP